MHCLMGKALKADKKMGSLAVVVVGYMDLCFYISLVLYYFYETGSKAVAACGTIFGGAVFNEYGGIFSRVNKIFSTICDIIFDGVSAGICFAVNGVRLVAAYGDSNMRLVKRRTRKYDTISGERKGASGSLSCKSSYGESS